MMHLFRGSGFGVDRAVNFLDKLFLILFSRARRSLGDEYVRTAWHRAIYTLAGYLVILTIILVVLIMLVTHVLIGARISVLDKRPWQAIGVFTFLLAYFAMYRRYLAYQSSPPSLIPMESAAHSRFMCWFRGVSVGALVTVLLLAFLASAYSD